MPSLKTNLTGRTAIRWSRPQDVRHGAVHVFQRLLRRLSRRRGTHHLRRGRSHRSYRSGRCRRCGSRRATQAERTGNHEPHSPLAKRPTTHRVLRFRVPGRHQTGLPPMLPHLSGHETVSGGWITVGRARMDLSAEPRRRSEPPSAPRTTARPGWRCAGSPRSIVGRWVGLGVARGRTGTSAGRRATCLRAEGGCGGTDDEFSACPSQTDRRRSGSWWHQEVARGRPGSDRNATGPQTHRRPRAIA